MTVVFLAVSFPVTAGAESFPSASPTLEEVSDQITSPADLAQWMHHYFEFRRDEVAWGEEDHWQRPEEFLIHRRGDCEDFALFSQSILERKGLEAYVISLYGMNGYAHTVTVFQDKGLFYVLNEDRLDDDGKPTIEAALSEVYGAWSWAAVAEERNGRGWMIQRIKNPS